MRALVIQSSQIAASAAYVRRIFMAHAKDADILNKFMENTEETTIDTSRKLRVGQQHKRQTELFLELFM